MIETSVAKKKRSQCVLINPQSSINHTFSGQTTHRAVESPAVNTATMHMQSMLAKLWVGYTSLIFHRYCQLLHNYVISDEKQIVLLAGFQDKSELWIILTN